MESHDGNGSVIIVDYLLKAGCALLGWLLWSSLRGGVGGR